VAVPEPAVTTWLEHAVAYADMKWPRLAPHSRAGLADALATVTPALTRPTAMRPPARTLRAALHRHAFNPQRRAGPMDPAEARALGWLARASLPVTQLSDPGAIRAALDTLTVRLDGGRAAAATVARKRAVFHDALVYAVELGLLAVNPLGQVRWAAPRSATAVNPQTVASPAQVRAILAEVARLHPELTAFFGCLYYAALRPEEAVALQRADLVLAATRAGQANPHQRLPADRLSVDQHRYAARAAQPQAPSRRSCADRPGPASAGQLAPAASARVRGRAGRAAFAAAGAAEILERWPGHAGALALLAVAGTVIGEPAADAAWPWPTPRLSYANAAIAEAVIVAGEKLGRDQLLRDGLRMLGWLLAGETRNGHLSVVPAGGWGRGEGRPAFDQYPIEVAALADACARAAAVTGDSTWLTGVEMSVTWLLGDNDARIPMLDERTGGCSDALSRTSRSRNQGAESTLAMISVLQQGRRLAATAAR
jgi:integrase